AEASTGAVVAESVERRAGAKGNTHQQSTHWTQSQFRVSQALARIRQLVPSHTRGRSRMRESRTYGSVRGACDETPVPPATPARIHRPARRRDSVAARGARAASRRLRGERVAHGTDWEKNHARDRSCFAQYRNNGFAAHRRRRQAPVERRREPG